MPHSRSMSEELQLRKDGWPCPSLPNVNKQGQYRGRNSILNDIYSIIIIIIIIIITLLLLKPWIMLDDRHFVPWRGDGEGRGCERKAFCTFRTTWPSDHDSPLSGILFSNLLKNKHLLSSKPIDPELFSLPYPLAAYFHKLCPSY
jgi:hypothetical protein